MWHLHYWKFANKVILYNPLLITLWMNYPFEPFKIPPRSFSISCSSATFPSRTCKHPWPTAPLQIGPANWTFLFTRFLTSIYSIPIISNAFLMGISLSPIIVMASLSISLHIVVRVRPLTFHVAIPTVVSFTHPSVCGTSLHWGPVWGILWYNFGS